MLISVEVNKTNRKKSVGFSVRWPDTMVVSAPQRLEKKALDEMVASRLPWAERRLARISEEYKRLGLPKQYEGGEAFPYLGEQYPLMVIASGNKSRSKCDLENGRFVVEIKLADEEEQPGLIRKALAKWYRGAAETAISGSVTRWAPVIGCEPAAIKIRNQRARWGSCSRQGSINLNWRLVLLPPELLDYVVVHELCHLKQPNHSAKFWKVVEASMPDYRNLRKRLRGYASYLDMV